jgi:hypothetical protein
MRILRLNQHGFSFIELLVWSSISTIVLMGVTRITATQVRLSSRINHNLQEQALNRAVEMIRKDLENASYQSVSSQITTTAPSQSITYFAQFHFDGVTRKTVFVEYYFDAPTATLWRYEDASLTPSVATSKKTVIISNVFPEFRLDAGNNSTIVILKLTYRPPGAAIPGQAGTQSITVNDRVSVRG